MRKAVILVVLLSFALATMPVFAQGQEGSGSPAESAKAPAESIFQIASDNISDIAKLGLGQTEAPKVEVFQNISDRIAEGPRWDELSAKDLSLRENAEELEKRRGARCN